MIRQTKIWRNTKCKIEILSEYPYLFWMLGKRKGTGKSEISCIFPIVNSFHLEKNGNYNLTPKKKSLGP